MSTSASTQVQPVVKIVEPAPKETLSHPLRSAREREIRQASMLTSRNLCC